MSAIDFILNLAALLLWLSWRAARFDPLVRAGPITLVGTLRRAEPLRLQRWHLLAVLAALVILRGVLYWQIGSAVDWIPLLRLGAIAISFRSDYFLPMLIFSLLSFLATLGVFYLWLLLLSLVNGRPAEGEPFQRLVRLHLGWIERLPWVGKLLLPFLLTSLLWLALNPLLVRWSIVPGVRIPAHRFEQAAIIAFCPYLTWKFLIGGILALYVMNSYVYIGSHPFWKYIEATGNNLLAPLRWAHLRLGKVDFAPIVEIALVFLIAELSERGLTLLYSRLAV